MPQFESGTRVQVLDESRKVWIDGIIFRRWNEVDIPSGERRITYDVDGTDENGPWHGRFTADHVRESVSLLG